MIVTCDNGKKIDLSKGYDISLPLSDTPDNPRAWYVQPPVFAPVMEDGWVGEVRLGGGVNFRNIFFNPHGHGTHTECLGHITEEIYSVQNALKTFFYDSLVVSVIPEIIENKGEKDAVVTAATINIPSDITKVDALIIRTLPNSEMKLTANYSDTNPAYLALDCLDIVNRLGVKHLLIDLPSVDREKDGGALAFHHTFWNVPENPDFERTITELIFVSDEVKDGRYLLNLQVANFVNDAAPSRPILYPYL
jgi:arylformamidase